MRENLVPSPWERARVRSQCPFAGGNAVYLARNFVALLNDSVVYDDNATCEQGSRFIQIQADPKNNSLPIISLSPNPANNQFKISISNLNVGICKVQVTNIFGAVVLNDEFNCRDQIHIINAETLSPGVYTVCVSIPQLPQVVNKLIIVR